MEAGALSNPVLRARRNLTDRIGDPLLRGLSGLAAAVAVVVIGAIAYEVVHLAGPAISEFGLGFVTTNDWNPVTERFGAAPFLYGTAVTSCIALLFAAPLSIAISIYLTELAPKPAAAPGGDPGRHARRDPERHPRSLGDPRPRSRSCTTRSSRR